ncbi:Hypothetical protein CINCED_3A015880 [Cinara cedri]|uniref:Uncharacterized protein n=1 Tax=Cinara cedri TaxID=506608 RepID=A0A5E4NQN4_9HEMI|nr:Hypothetical protein CINCED_3A015880 [Cinara cedri]
MVLDTKICIKNLVPRDTSYYGQYQNLTDPMAASVRHNYDMLCLILHEAAGSKMEVHQDQTDFTVHAIHQVTKTSDDGKRPELIDSRGPSAANENRVPAMLAREDEEMPATQVVSNIPIVVPAAGEKPGRTEKAAAVDVTEDKPGRNEKSASCPDLKSIVKLSRLCNVLNANVMELKSFYENEGYSYSKVEHAVMNLGLQSLLNDMPNLLSALNEIDGHREKIQEMLEMYSSYESRYRELRKICSRTKSREKTTRTIRNDDKHGLCTATKEYARGLFNECCIL